MVSLQQAPFFWQAPERVGAWMELPSQLRKHRERLGLSQEDVAAAIYVSRQTLSSWERGKTYPDVQSLLLLSQLFGFSLDELIVGDLATWRKTVEEDSKKAKWLMGIAIGSAVLGVIFLVIPTVILREPGIGNFTVGNMMSMVLFAPLYAICMGALVAIERIKKKHDLVTYREIEAFMQGKPLEDDTRDSLAFSRSHPVLLVVAKFAAGALFGAFIGWVIFVIL
ncbi:helix-turn-helix domain-containing protein [bacterium D16-34]|nr:helix-turn-helix domain-containing protein [bacterium D16-34]